MTKQSSASHPERTERRSFLNRFQVGAVSLAALAVGRTALAQDKASPASGWKPMLHEKDAWMDELPGVHRLVFDTTSEQGMRDALLYTSNYIAVNSQDYEVQSTDLAIIVIARHVSTAFAYNDAMWAKYGAAFMQRMGGGPPAAGEPAKEAPKTNPMARQLGTLARQGVQFAVCSMATQAIAGMAARASGGNAGEVNEELKANLVTNGRMVPAGIVAVDRAQERGYSLVTTG